MLDAEGWSASPGGVIVSLVPVALWVIALVCTLIAVRRGPRRNAGPILYTDFLTPIAILILLFITARSKPTAELC